MTTVSRCAGSVPGGAATGRARPAMASGRVACTSRRSRARYRRLAATSKRHSRIRPAGCARAAPRNSQPSSHCCSVPGHARAAACSSARISTVRTGAAGQRPHRDHVVGCDLDDRTGFRPHTDPGPDSQQVTDHVGQRRHRTCGPPVAQASTRVPTAGRPATSVTERVGILAGHPRQAGHAPAVRLHRPLGAAGVPADQPVQVEKPVQVPGLVLQHPREQTGALQRDRACRRRPGRSPAPSRRGRSGTTRRAPTGSLRRRSPDRASSRAPRRFPAPD